MDSNQSAKLPEEPLGVRLSIVIFIVIFGVIGAITVLFSHAAILGTGTITTGGGGLCLTDPGGITTNGTSVTVTACKSSAAIQSWQVDPTNETIAAAGGTACLGVNAPNGQLTVAHPAVQLFGCRSSQDLHSSYQQWQVDGGALLNLHSGMCLTVPPGSTQPTSGTKLELYDCQSGSNVCTPSAYMTCPLNTTSPAEVGQQWVLPNTTPIPAPTINFSASTMTLTPGASTTLVWSTTNTTSCTASGAWSGNEPTSGNQNTGALAATSTYILSCSGAGGSAQASVKVTVSSTNAVVPVVYESTTNTLGNGYSASTALKALGANFVLRGLFQWGDGAGIKHGFTTIQNNIAQLRSQISGLTFEGGIGGQYFAANSTWPDGSAVTSQQLSSIEARDGRGNPLPYSTGYVPDLASTDYQDYLVDWGEKQIDAGVDGLFIDDPFHYAMYRVKYGLYDASNPNADRTYTNYANALYGSTGVMGRLQQYAQAHNRSFFLTINSAQCGQLAQSTSVFTKYPQLLRPETFITCSFNDSDFSTGTPGFPALTENYGQITSGVSQIMGRSNVPIMAFIDWPHEMGLFDKLTLDNQKLVLKSMAATTKAAGVIFAPPLYVHGENYDATQNGTYTTLVQLPH